MHMDPISALVIQSDTRHVESMLAKQYALVRDVPSSSVSIDELRAHADELHSRIPQMLPVGSVEFVRLAMEIGGIEEPKNISYPLALRPFLHRRVEERAAGEVLGHWFIKPVETKRFTGFVFDTLSNPDHLSGHDHIQYGAFLSMEADERVWISEPVQWGAEVRYYVLDGKIIGAGRYDDGPDEATMPDETHVQEMVRAYVTSGSAPAAFGLDVGVLSSGQTALVECNDAWALGYYKGSLLQGDYIAMLWRRWIELAAAAGALA